MRPAVKKSISVLAAFFAVWLAARFLLPLCFPFLLGALLAFAAEPMVGFLQKRRVPRCVCSGIGVSMAFCFLAMLVLILCAFALRELRRVAGVLPDLENPALTCCKAGCWSWRPTRPRACSPCSART